MQGGETATPGEGARQEKQTGADLAFPTFLGGRFEGSIADSSVCICSFNYFTILIGHYHVPGPSD